MDDVASLETKIKSMIDDLKRCCFEAGINATSGEEEIITEVFLYKFLNDKFIYNLNNFASDRKKSTDEILNSELLLNAFYDTYSQDVAFRKEDTIQYLANLTTQEDFSKKFDEALERISNYDINKDFSVRTAIGERNPLFERITEKVTSNKRDNFAKDIFGILIEEKFDFSEAFKSNFDFYSTIFEYLIHDYNKDSGKMGEYYTPQSVSSIIAKILVEMSPIEDKLYDIYDPCAGSGSLILHLANALGNGPLGEKAQIYTQDKSLKSTNFLRLNMLLNGLSSSLENVVEDDTLTNPAHYTIQNVESSGLKQFDFITSNPPFNSEISHRDSLVDNWKDSDARDGLQRFFAGVPKVPEKNPDAADIYLCFIQHILYSLKSDGKAAIVVPTGFLTKKGTIEMKIRQTIVDKHWLKGVISMPSNIFATTGTNVSVLFIDKSNKDENLILIDASNLGEKRKDGKTQRTFLSDNEIQLIEDAFIKKEIVEGFSVLVSFDQVIQKNYSYFAGHYFEVKLDYIELSEDEFNKKIKDAKSKLEKYFNDNEDLSQKIYNSLDGFKYEM